MRRQVGLYGISNGPAQLLSLDQGWAYECLHRRGCCLPTLKLLVDNFAPLEVPEVGREVVELLSGVTVLVGDGNLEDGEGIEDIELCSGVSLLSC